MLIGVAALAALLLSGCGGGDRLAGSSTISACMDPREAPSADIRRKLPALRGEPVCYRRQQVTEGDFRWVFHILEHTRAPGGPFWVLPHDNENAAFDAAVHGVLTYGGGLLMVSAGGSRQYRGQDPNRNFSTSRAESRLCIGQRRPAPRFTRAILGHYQGRRSPYLALHNNGDGHSGNGGRGNVSMLRPHPMLSQWPGGGVGSAALRDEDNLVFMAGTRPAYADPAVRRRIAELNRAGLNVLHKHVTTRSFDCSMSDYIARHRLGEYFNIEAQHGARRAQTEMLDRLMAVLGVRPLRAKAKSIPFLE
jgi:hypothetical protein